MKTIALPFQSFSLPELTTAGRAIYTPRDFKDGIDCGHHYVAQVFAEPDHDIPETAEILADSKVLTNDFEADKIAAIMAASPRLANLLLRLTHPSIPRDQATVIEAQVLLGSLGFDMDRA